MSSEKPPPADVTLRSVKKAHLDRGDTLYDWKGAKPYRGRFWAYSKEKMQESENEGRLVYTRTGMPEYKRYLDEMPGVPLQDNLDGH